MPEHRVKLTLHYDGRNFHGWQLQPDVPTVQGELDAALSKLTDRPTTSTAAGRTDRGVHATGQVASALVPERWSSAALRRSLNAVLPQSIRVVHAEEVDDDFHARFDAVARSYVYRVGTTESSRSPFRRLWCWPLGKTLDGAILEEAAATVTGEHSFRSFARSGQPERGYRCTVHSAEWRTWAGHGLSLHVSANRFLHHMVRYLVGTMVEMARGRRSSTELPKLLAGDPELTTSPPAPPEGLFLVRVHYPDDDSQTGTTIDEDLP